MKTLAQIEPRTPIASLPANITTGGSYYVTTNLIGGSGQNGITISSGNVTVDLNGYTVSGVSGSFAGIAVNGSYTNITARNGIITGWGGNGLDAAAGSPRNLLFENLIVSANGGRGISTEAGSILLNCLSTSNRSDGIFSNGGQITHCVSRANVGNGITAADCDVSDCRVEYNLSSGLGVTRSRALGCTAEKNASAGIYCNLAANEVRNCRVSGNGFIGIRITGYTVVADNLVVSNSIYGIYFDIGSGGSQITDNTCVGNAGAGILVQENGSFIANNSVITSAGISGISVTSGAYSNNVIVKNIVAGNGANNFSVFPGLNDVGPIGNAATNNSPWGNISH